MIFKKNVSTLIFALCLSSVHTYMYCCSRCVPVDVQRQIYRKDYSPIEYIRHINCAQAIIDSSRQ